MGSKWEHRKAKDSDLCVCGSERVTRGKRNGRQRWACKAQRWTERHDPYKLNSLDVGLFSSDRKCATCENLATVVDHCHVSGIVRGALCTQCNLTLGLIKDSPETLRRLAEYLENNTPSL